MHPAPYPALPDNLRIYAIGDIHGRLDLLQQLMQKITADSHTTTAPVQIIFLGDYIDRGMQSKQVLDFLLAQDPDKTQFLMGNHEQVMRDILTNSDERLMIDWMRWGGRETLMSYGIRPPALMIGAALSKVVADFIQKVPPVHLALLKRMPTSTTYGDYYFCHAGVKPNVPLASQSDQDLVWIRGEFLAHTAPHEKVIVHGHSISTAAELLPHRINVDTGAYATGCLTAIALEGSQQWLVQTKS